MRLIEYDATQLTPEAWRSGGTARAFNPTIAEVDGGYALAYRVVQLDSEHRRIATARLDRDLALVPGSVVPLSDELTFADPALGERSLTWHADPVYLRLRGRLYLMWNDGANRPVNHQFLAPMSEDGQHVAGPAKEITTVDRRDVEKNWTLFEVDDEVYATYSYRPHRVLRVDLDTEDTTIVATPAYTSGFDTRYEQLFGIVRGGAQPQRIGENFVSVAHSSYTLPEGRVYRAVHVEFEAKPPFRILRMSTSPIDLPSHVGSTFAHAKLNPDVQEVVYPRGLICRDDEWIISYGLNDEECAIAVTPGGDQAIGPVADTVTEHTLTSSDAVLEPASRSLALPEPATELPLFWFDAKSKLFDGFPQGRRFATGNFGDIASYEVARSLSGVTPRTSLPGEPRLLAIGSVLQRARPGDVVWGSGVKGGSDDLPHGLELDVRAVRGPLSVEYLERSGIPTEKITHLFDPGVLFPHLYEEELSRAESRGGDRIVPHYHDDLALRRRHYRQIDDFVSVDTTPLGMMQALKGADRVFASSLHGVIFAEAMGIPAYWLAPVGGEDELKYYDYYYGTGRTDVKRFESLEEAMASDPMPLPTFDIDAYLATFPHDAVAELATPALKPGQRLEFREWEPQGLGRTFALSGFGLRDRAGLWMTARKATLAAAVRAEPGERLEVSVAFTPAGTGALPGAQRLRARANGGPVREVEWRRGGKDKVEVLLEFRADAPETVLRIDLELEHFGAPVEPVAPPAPAPAPTGLARARAIAARLAGKKPASAPKPAPVRRRLERGGLITGLRLASRTRRA